MKKWYYITQAYRGWYLWRVENSSWYMLSMIVSLEPGPDQEWKEQ